MKNTTIAAISTAQGAGGIGVIRISGDDAVLIADRVFKSATEKKLSQMKGYTAAFGHIYNGENLIDEAIATVFIAPHSYTGENVVELSCHGGVYVTNQVLRAVLDNGAVTAQAGEFTKRAFLNGKLDLTEAEAVMDLISAKSAVSARTALCVKDGAIRKKIDIIKESLLDKAAHLSAWADYPEEDIEQVTEDSLLTSFDENIKSLEQLLATYDMGQAVKEGIDTVIAGKPNVGKSTLMNLLAGHERSIVTAIHGPTRDVIEETVVIGNVILRLSDTAGLHATDDTVEKIGVDKTRKRLSECGLVFAVLDGNLPLTDEDKDLIEQVKDSACIAIINKADLAQKIDIQYIKNNIHHIVYISAVTGQGIESLTNAVLEVTDTKNFDPSEGILANERQRDAVRNALNSLKETKNALEMGLTFDAVTVELEEAISSLLELTGERTSEAVVDKVFHNFCVGK